jgi:ABC-2 type transport system permease protein
VTRLISAELFKLRKRAMTSILLLIMIGIIIVLYFVLLAISNVRLPGGQTAGNIESLLGLKGALPFAMTLLATFGSALGVVLVASGVGNEYNWRTIRTMLISSESRVKLLGAKLVAMGTYILLGLLIGIVAGFIMSLITTAIAGRTFDFGFFTGTYAWNQFLQFWRTFYIMLPYLLLAFLFAIVGRSAMPGIAVAIGVFFLEGIVSTLMYAAGGWVADIPAYLINANFSAISRLNDLPRGVGGAFEGGLVQLPSTTHAAIALAIYIIIFAGAGFYTFIKRDVTV